MKYVGQCGITGEWIGRKEVTKDVYEEHRFKTLPELNAAITLDWQEEREGQVLR